MSPSAEARKAADKEQKCPLRVKEIFAAVTDCNMLILAAHAVDLAFKN